ncbi:MAG: alpha/beta hydrolase [Chloroflexi bacterium]|nr:alpha/beta hydrolase [Chloroflexota bacterium]
MTGQDRFIDIGLTLHVREWPGDKNPFVLLHGLSSNCRTWEAVATRLAAAGHRVVTVDQRGHGLSDKPTGGFDFATVTADLARLLPALRLEQPIVVGQSWGGNVVLEFGARYPGLAHRLGFVDGGFLDLQARLNGDWDSVSIELRPADLNGMLREVLKNRIQEDHPDWSDEGLEATLANFETLPDGTIRRWLDTSYHMLILRALWEQRPQELYPQVTAPVLICVADSGDDWSEYRRNLVAVAEAGLRQTEVYWFPATDHDIHVHRPDALVELFLHTLQSGAWR